MYFGARMLLYRYLLNPPGSAVGKMGLHAEDMKLYMTESGVAAQHTARILGIMAVDGIVETRCWIIM